MGLKTLVREELKLLGLTWNHKANQAVPNKYEAARLASRQRGYETNIAQRGREDKPADAYTMPGSYRK